MTAPICPDHAALRYLEGTEIVKALALHAAARPPRRPPVCRFSDPSPAEMAYSYAISVWEAGMVALLRHLGRVVLDAVDRAHPGRTEDQYTGLLWAILDACPHACDEDAAASAALDHRERGGDIANALRKMQYEYKDEPITGPDGYYHGDKIMTGMRADDVLKTGGLIIDVLVQVYEHLKITTPVSIMGIKKSLTP